MIELGLPRLGEVVDVDPIGRNWLGRGLRADEVVHGGASAGSGRPHDEDVEVVVAHLQAEADRLDRARLGENPIQRDKLRRGRKREAGRVAEPP